MNFLFFFFKAGKGKANVKIKIKDNGTACYSMLLTSALFALVLAEIVKYFVYLLMEIFAFLWTYVIV